MRRLKPTEIRAVADLLDSPASDADELARIILRKVNELRDREALWVVGVGPDSGPAQIFGPYLTLAEAQRAVASGAVLVGFGRTTTQVGFWRLQGRDVECDVDHPVSALAMSAPTGTVVT